MTIKELYRSLKHLAMILIIGLLLFTSCTKHDTYSVIPEIEYKSFDKIPTSSGIDDKALLTISFTDGDGDIGLNPEDTFPPYNASSPYYYNFIIDYYEQQGDSFVKIDLPFTNNSRIPYVEADLVERGIKGEITIEVFFNNIMSNADSIRYELYILDRSLHKSNSVTTPSIFVKKSL